MPGDGIVTVQSIQPSAGVPVAVTVENVSGQGSAAIQWVTVRSGGQPIGTVVASIPGGLTLPGSLSVAQMAAPWSWVGSAVVQGSVFAAATQVSSPWAMHAGSTGTFQGFTVASVPGGVAITAAPSLDARVQGSLTVFQGGVWSATAVVASATVLIQQSMAVFPAGSWSMVGTMTVAGSVFAGVSQVTSPWYTQAGSSGQFLGFAVVSVVGGGAGGGAVTQATTPWLTRVVSGDAISPRSWAGGPLLRVSLENGTLTAGADGAILDFADSGLGVNVTSLALGNALKVDLVAGNISISGADGAITDGSTPAVRATVRSYASSNPLLVGLVSPTGAHLTVFSVNAVGSVNATVSSATALIQGSMTVYWGQSLTVMGSMQATVASATALIQGSLSVFPATSWSMVGSMTVAGSVHAGVTQVTSPWAVFPGSTGAFQGFSVVSLVGVPSVLTQQSLTVFWGQSLTVTGSVAATVSSATALIQGSLGVFPAGSWSMVGTMTVAGSVFAGVSQVTSPWVTRTGSTGDFQGFVVASVPGLSIAVASGLGVITQPSITVFWGQSLTVMGSVQATVASATALIQQSMTVFPGGSWSMVGTMTAAVASATALIQGSMAVFPATSWTMIGSMTVAGSVFAGVTQVTSPWVIFPGSTGAFQGFTVSSVIGQPTVTASIIGTISTSVAGTLVVSMQGVVETALGATRRLYENHEFTFPGSWLNWDLTNSFNHAGSCTCARSMFSRVGSAQTLSIRNVSLNELRFRVGSSNADVVTVDAGEQLFWDALVFTRLFASNSSTATARMRVALT